MNDDVPNCFQDEQTAALLLEICKKHEVDERLLRELCALTDDYAGSGNKRGISSDAEQVIDEFRKRSEEQRGNHVSG